MAATVTREATRIEIDTVPEVEENTSLRLVHNALLTELPGAAIGFVTLYYLVSSLIALM